MNTKPWDADIEKSIKHRTVADLIEEYWEEVKERGEQVPSFKDSLSYKRVVTYISKDGILWEVESDILLINSVPSFCI